MSYFLSKRATVAGATHTKKLLTMSSRSGKIGLERLPYVAHRYGERRNSRVVTKAVKTNFDSAKEAIESSLPLFKEGKIEEALEGYQAALKMDPNADEARAAHYNSACCYTKLRKWDEAADSVVSAVNDYDLKFIVALKDDDLKELREQPVFDRVVGEVTGGLSQEAYIKARQEARSPFMLVRTIALGGLSAGAALGLIIITGRLIAAIRGGEGAPDLQQTLQNFGINAGALALLVFLLARDQRRKKRELGVIEREERLAKLQVQDDGGRAGILATLRGIARPVIVAGTRGHVQKALKSAEPYRAGIRERGIELIPVVINNDDPSDRILALKQELAMEEEGRKAQGFSKASRGKDNAPEAGAEKQDAMRIGKRRLAAVEIKQWEDWLNEIRKTAGVEDFNVYAQVQLDGSVRASGVGIPPWEKFMSDIPPMDDIRSKFMQ